MNPRTKIAAVAVALLLGAGAAGAATASSPAAAPSDTAAPAADGPREAAALTGTAKLFRPAPADDDITFSFDAHLAAEHRGDPQAATGTFRYSHYAKGQGGYAVAEVDCLVTGGEVAVVTGVVVDTDVKELRKKRVGVTVHDLGERDRLGYSWVGRDTNLKVPPCLSSAPFETVKAGTGDFDVLPWEPPYQQ
ncbi:Repetin [Streptomyces sp. NPDC058955]|uniref:Repetin n=1 Tax=unclassified Streptomyces TaxID=2593676 RepID=UPI00365B5F81